MVLDAAISCELHEQRGVLRRAGSVRAADPFSGGRDAGLCSRCVVEVAVEASVADEATVGSTADKEIKRVKDTQMGPSKGLFLRARRARELRYRHGSNLPQLLTE